MSVVPSEVEALWAQRTRFLQPILSYRRQRQLVGMLFRELALAARRKFALDLIAESIAASPRVRPGARYLHSALLVLLVALVATLEAAGWTGTGIVLGVVGGVGLFFLCVAPHEDYVRHVAGRLADSLAQGCTLSEAMWQQPRIFTSQERHVVAIGEQTGYLPESLESLAEYNVTTSELNRLAAAVLYPFLVLAFCLMIVSFIAARIIPKYVDLFAQMGAELPATTVGMVNVVRATSPLWFLFGLCAPVLIGAAILIIIPRLLGGSTFMTVAFFALVGLVALFIYGSAALAATMPTAGALEALAVFALAIVGAGLTAVVAYFVVRELTMAVPGTIGALATRVFGWLRPLRNLEMSRFLHSLGFSLRAGIPAPEALEMAGHAVRGSLRADAVRFRAMVEQGHSISECLKSSRRFRGPVAAILSLAEWRGSIADDCVELAGQLRAQAERASLRLAAAIELPSIIVIGLALGAFAIACYLPLFNIPKLVQ